MKSKVWTYDNIIKYKSEEMRKVVEDGVENIMPSEEMKRFKPLEEEMSYGSSQRLIFYN